MSEPRRRKPAGLFRQTEPNVLMIFGSTMENPGIFSSSHDKSSHAPPSILEVATWESLVTSTTFSTAGTYTDTTDQFQFVDADGVILNVGIADADVFDDGDATITVTAGFDYIFAGGFSGGTVTLNGGSDRFYGGNDGVQSVTANGTGNLVFGSDNT